MEYTKDIILNVNQMAINKLKLWRNSIIKSIKNNKLIAITLTSLVILITIDIALVNSFLNIFMKLQ